ncbi:hypothetical protein [Sideroxydans lithotrophicus]|uniref:Uncharacterized protein n=1 Tax=Sideroxydans lithotrophicus (strain ES-1) TaxID=580332 RepID=D5CTA7_SIDLE|nr:hypothetical protein [Sideroxydans lithotrophicus]ADE12193.1 hypothetical protein Slit_1964 [Sideroxydans lithotrophicus ES-1]
MTSKQIKKQKYAAIRKAAAKHFVGLNYLSRGKLLRLEFNLRFVQKMIRIKLQKFVGMHISPELRKQMHAESCRSLESMFSPPIFTINIPKMEFILEGAKK